MLTVTKREKYKFNYECDCGAHGFCLIKPMNDCATVLITMKCPICLKEDVVTLPQLDDDDFTWAIIIENKIEV